MKFQSNRNATLLAGTLCLALGAISAAHAAVFIENFNSASGSNLYTNTADQFSERWSNTQYLLDAPSLTGWTFVDQVIVAYNGVDSTNKALLLNETGVTKATSPLIGVTGGQAYQLTFDHWGDNRPGVTYSFEVAVNGAVLDTISRSWSASGGWATASYTFPAPSSSISLSFKEISAGQASPIIDNLTVTAVPEPETWAMMLAGLSFLGWVSRRRRQPGSVTAA